MLDFDFFKRKNYCDQYQVHLFRKFYKYCSQKSHKLVNKKELFEFYKTYY